MITFEETSQFCDQMSMVLSSGLSIAEGLETIAEDVEDRDFKKAIDQMINEISRGSSFYNASDAVGVFDNYFLEMVRIGEKTGYLDRVMRQSAIYYQRIGEMQSKVKDAFFYPVILLSMMVVLMGILVIKVLPIFRDVLNSMGIDMALNSVVFMNVGQLVAKYGLLFLIILIVLVGCAYAVYKIKYRQTAMIQFLSDFPLTKRLMINIEISKIAYALSLQINSGMKMNESFALLDKLVESTSVRDRIRRCILDTEEGMDGVGALIDSSMFKSMYNRMIRIGLKTGKLDETMTKVAEEYEIETNNSIHRFLNAIEPTLMMSCVIVVGIILVSVMLPLVSIMTSIAS